MLVNQMGPSMPNNVPDPGVALALDAMIEALGDIAEGVGEAASNIDINV